MEPQAEAATAQPEVAGVPPQSEVFPSETDNEAPVYFASVASSDRGFLFPIREGPLDAATSSAPLQALRSGSKSAATASRSLAAGLAPEMAAWRLEKEGPNMLPNPRPRPLQFHAHLFLRQLLELINFLFLNIALASFLAERPDLGFMTLFFVALKAAVNAATAKYIDATIEAVQQKLQPQTLVIRGSCKELVPSSTLVRGDVVVLKAGDVVAADLCLLASSNLEVTEEAVTGEAHSVAKSATAEKGTRGEGGKPAPNTMVYSSSRVVSGTAKGIVVATGERTRIATCATMERKDSWGRLLAPKSTWKTPMLQRLKKLRRVCDVLAILVFMLFFVVGLLLNSSSPDDKPKMSAWMYLSLASLTLTLAAVPQGLPLSVAMALCRGCLQIVVDKGVHVRCMASLEMLGSASVLCVTHTGVLTEGQMRAVSMWVAGSDFEVSSAGGVLEVATGQEASSSVAVRSTLLAALMASQAKVYGVDEDGQPECSGSDSDGAVVRAASRLGFRTTVPGKLLELPFCQRRQVQLSVYSVSDEQLGEDCLQLPGGTEVVACLQGKPSSVLGACGSWLCPDGTLRELSPDEKKSFLARAEGFAAQGLRVLAVALRPMERLPYEATDEVTEEDKRNLLCQGQAFLGLVACADPPRQRVQEAVKAARQAGLGVVMITEDCHTAAVAVGQAMGILPENPVGGVQPALACSSLRNKGKYLADVELDAKARGVRVFSDASPSDRLELLKSLKRRGLTSILVSDRDAQLLQAADVSVAMGQQGTEAARQTADMVLADGNIETLLKAVAESRIVISGVRKFMTFLLSVHMAAGWQILLCIFAGLPVMRTPIQIQYLIFLGNLLPFLPEGLRPEDVEGAEHVRDGQPLLSSKMWVRALANSCLLAVAGVALYAWALGHYLGHHSAGDIEEIAEGGELSEATTDGLVKAQTVAFMLLLGCQVLWTFNSHSLQQPVWAQHRYKRIAAAGGLFALFLAVLMPGLFHVLGLNGWSVGIEGWLVALAGAVAVAVAVEAYKVAMRLVAKGQAALREQQAKGTGGAEMTCV